MSDVKRFAKNTFSLFAMQIITSIMIIILSIFIARNFGDVGLGKYSFAYAFVTFFALFINAGYNTLIIREVSRDKSRANKYVSNLLSLRSIIITITYVIVVITINLMGYPSDTKNLVYLFGVFIFLGEISAIYKMTFRAFQRMEYEALITIIFNTIRVTLALVVIFLGYGLIAIGLVFIFSSIIDLILSTIICERKFVKSKTEFDLSFFKSNIKIALPLLMVSLFGIIFYRADTIMLSIMKGDAVVGWYNAAYNLVVNLHFIPHLIVSSLLPILSNYYMNSKMSLNFAYEKCFRYLFILGLPMAMGGTLLSDKIILLIYGPGFMNSIIALQILSWDILLIFMYTILGAFLISIDKQNKMAICFFITAVVNVVFNLILIPMFSYVGSAVATLICEIVLFILYFYFLSKYIYIFPIHKILLKPFVALIVMTLFILFFNWLGLFTLIILGALMYFAILYIIKGFSKEDIALIKQIFKIRDLKENSGDQ